MRLYDRYTINDASAVSKFTSRVYGWMSLGLAVTAAVAFSLYASGAFLKLLSLWWVWGLGTFGIAMTINVSIHRLSLPAVMGLFVTYAALEGMLFGTILPFFAMAYGGHIIWAAFAVGAVVFLSAMLYGMFTKADLTGLGKILTIGLIGLVAVTLVYFVLSFFMSLTWLDLLISYVGLILFVGLTAYDAQTIRSYSMQADVQSVTSYKLSLIMALKMYINVIMIFWYLLRIFSSSRKN